MKSSIENPLLSVVVPVWNEHKGIHNFLLELQKDLANHFDAGKSEILICDGHPEQSTLAVLSESERKNIIALSCSPGRGLQMNAGAKKARGKVLLFLHADSRLEKSAWTVLKENTQKSLPTSGAFHFAIDSPQGHFRIVEYFTNLRSRLRRMPYGDQALFFAVESFRKVDGFPNSPVLEDVGIMKKVRQKKIDFVLHKEKVFCSARRWEKLGILRTTLVNRIMILLYILKIPPSQLVDFYREPGIISLFKGLK